MKLSYIIVTLIVVALIFSSFRYFSSATETVVTGKIEPVYQFKVTDINGKEFDFASLKGKKIMIVNTASKCGLTPQYEALQEIYNDYSKLHDFIIVGFPANNFLWQEPGSDKEISEFCANNYGVTFPMMSKIDVKGKEQHPIYKYLTTKSLNGISDNKVKWNFQKYLIGRDGKLELVITPKTKPNSPEVIHWITKG